MRPPPSPLLCLTASLTLLLIAASFSVAETPATSDSSGFGDEADVAIICENCQKEVSGDAQYGSKCPHCGIEWQFEVAPLEGPAEQAYEGSGRPIFETTELVEDTRTPEERGEYTPIETGDSTIVSGPGNPQLARNDRPQAQAGAAQRLHVPPPPPANLGVQEEMDLSNLPLWMKASLFFGSLAIFYYFFLYRR